MGRTFLKTVPTLRQWDGQPLPAALQARVEREYQRLQTVDQQIRALEKGASDPADDRPDETDRASEAAG